MLAVPTAVPFVFAYGVGSAPKHRAEAERLGLACRVIADEQLGWDVDTPEDLEVFTRPDKALVAQAPVAQTPVARDVP